MKAIISCTVFLLLCMPAYVATAQTKSVAQDAKNVTQSIKSLGNLFKKKKDSTTATTGTGGAAPAANTTTKGKGNAGEPAPMARYIDADQLYPFNAGSALIRKGTSSALIDSAGNFLVPYNTYDITGIFVAGPVGYEVRYNGMYTYKNLDEVWGGYINAKGKIIIKTDVNTGVIDYTDNKQLLQNNNSTRNAVAYTYTTPEGKSYVVNQFLEHIVNGIGIVHGKPGTAEGYTYRKLTGETVAAGFDDAAPFSDGMARVGKKDAFGELKYGYINTQGKLVIPCTFSLVPDNFTGGFARVQPKDRSAFEYAFINKAGEIVFKQTQEDVYKNGSFDHFTNFGLAFSEKAVMDTTFRITPKAAFFQSFGIPADSWFVEPGAYTIGENNPKLVFSTRTARSPYTQMPVYGFINWKTKKVVMPVFDFINTNGLYFDPSSRRAYAKVCIGKDNKNVLVYREGYINEDGLFVLIKGQGSQW